MSKKYENVYRDDNGNYIATNKSRETGPGVSSASDSSSVKPAQEINRDMQANVISSMGPGEGPGSGHVTIGESPGGGSPISRRREKYSESTFDYTPYAPSARVRAYQNRLKAFENAEKPDWESRYEPAIQSILDGILNKKSFDLSKDANYQTLYDKYAQNYMALGNKAMRDQLGAASALTGGYGSTAAQAAAGQAYDSYMQGLNDRDMQLMQLAYQMYGDERADQYNQLGTVNNQDAIDYGRYRDDVGDFYTDRDYFANRYQQEYANDYNRYTDALNFGRSVYEDERDYETGLEDTEYGRYQDALGLAMQYAQKGLEVPAYIARTIKDYTGAADISDVIAAMPVSRGGSGGGGGGGRRSSGATAVEGYNPAANADDYEDAFQRALFYSSKGYDDPWVEDMLHRYGYSDPAIADAMRRLRPSEAESEFTDMLTNGIPITGTEAIPKAFRKMFDGKSVTVEGAKRLNELGVGDGYYDLYNRMVDAVNSGEVSANYALDWFNKAGYTAEELKELAEMRKNNG